MKSHEYALKLKETANYLLSRPEFETTSANESIYIGNYFDNKEGFLAAVRALGPGTKTYDHSDVQFDAKTPIPIWLRVSRSVVCRKVQEEKWECESLLTPDEDASITEQAAQ